MNTFFSAETPTCVAIIICNEIIEDKRTSNKTLVSLFNGIAVPSLPALHPRLFLMISLTNLHAETPVTFRITGPSGQELLHVDGVASSGGDPLEVVDMIVEVQALTLQEEGAHSVEVYAGDILLGKRQFRVIRQA